MDRILVTGGAGAIGSNLVRALQSKGFVITVLDDLSSGSVKFLPEGIELIRGRVEDERDVRLAFRCKPRYVCHLAALFANANSVDHPVRDLEVNGLGTLRVLEACKFTSVEKVLFVSSSCVFGTASDSDEDSTRFDPETPYAMSKLLGEHYSQFWAKLHHLNVAIVRPFNSYGPGELPGAYRNVIPNFLLRAMNREPLKITGTGEETRDFTYVDDTVDGILRVLFGKTVPGEIFNVSGASPTKILDLALLINELTGNPAVIEMTPRRDWDHVTHRRGSYLKLRERFGFQPTVSLKEGLGHTLEWLKRSMQ